MNGAPEAEFQDTLLSNLVQQSKTYLNTGQNFIGTTEDKIRLCLATHIDAVSKKKGWITPLTWSLTIILVFITSEFHDFVLSKDAWQAVFAIGLIISVIWLVKAVIDARRVSTSIDLIVDQLKLKPPSEETIDRSQIDPHLRAMMIANKFEPFG